MSNEEVVRPNLSVSNNNDENTNSSINNNNNSLNNKSKAAAKEGGSASNATVAGMSLSEITFPIQLEKALKVYDLGYVVSDIYSFHDRNHIWPVGYWSEKKYRSYTDITKKTTYKCEIQNGGDRPKFVVTAEDDADNPSVALSCNAAWQKIFSRLSNSLIAHGKAEKRKFTTWGGTRMYGLSHPVIMKLIEKLPGSEKCERYVSYDQQKEQQAQKPRKTRFVQKNKTLSFETFVGNQQPDRQQPTSASTSAEEKSHQKEVYQQQAQQQPQQQNNKMHIQPPIASSGSQNITQKVPPPPHLQLEIERMKQLQQQQYPQNLQQSPLYHHPVANSLAQAYGSQHQHRYPETSSQEYYNHYHSYQRERLNYPTEHPHQYPHGNKVDHKSNGDAGSHNQPFPRYQEPPVTPPPMQIAYSRAPPRIQNNLAMANENTQRPAEHKAGDLPYNFEFTDTAQRSKLQSKFDINFLTQREEQRTHSAQYSGESTSATPRTRDMATQTDPVHIIPIANTEAQSWARYIPPPLMNKQSGSKPESNHGMQKVPMPSEIFSPPPPPPHITGGMIFYPTAPNNPPETTGYFAPPPLPSSSVPALRDERTWQDSAVPSPSNYSNEKSGREHPGYGGPVPDSFGSHSGPNHPKSSLPSHGPEQPLTKKKKVSPPPLFPAPVQEATYSPRPGDKQNYGGAPSPMTSPVSHSDYYSGVQHPPHYPGYTSGRYPSPGYYHSASPVIALQKERGEEKPKDSFIVTRPHSGWLPQHGEPITPPAPPMHIQYPERSGSSSMNHNAHTRTMWPSDVPKAPAPWTTFAPPLYDNNKNSPQSNSDKKT